MPQQILWSGWCWIYGTELDLVFLLRVLALAPLLMISLLLHHVVPHLHVCPASKLLFGAFSLESIGIWNSQPSFLVTFPVL
jgi:hypothetical protein